MGVQFQHQQRHVVGEWCAAASSIERSSDGIGNALDSLAAGQEDFLHPLGAKRWRK